MTDLTGIDYLTGEDGIPISDLRFVTMEEENSESPIFPDTARDFGEFAALFVQKYGIGDGAAASGKPPVVLSPESLAVVRSYYDSTGGEIHNVNDRKARKSW